MSAERNALPWEAGDNPAYIDVALPDLEEVCRALVLPLPAKLWGAPAQVPVRVYQDGRCTAMIGDSEVSLLHGNATLWPRDSHVMWVRFLLGLSRYVGSARPQP